MKETVKGNHVRIDSFPSFPCGWRSWEPFVVLFLPEDLTTQNSGGMHGASEVAQLFLSCHLCFY